MKNIILRRFFPTFLCMALALILTSCDGKNQQPVESGTGSTVRTPSVSKEEGSSSERAVPLSKDKKDKSASNSESQKEDEPAPGFIRKQRRVPLRCCVTVCLVVSRSPERWLIWVTGRRGIPRHWGSGFWGTALRLRMTCPFCWRFRTTVSWARATVICTVLFHGMKTPALL